MGALPVLTLETLIEQQALAGRRVLIRADLNVPLDELGQMTDDTRLRASVPGIRAALQAGAQVEVISHLGRPTEGQLQPRDSLAPVAQRLAQLLAVPVILQTDWWQATPPTPPTSATSAISRQVVLLENCRGQVGESANDPGLAKRVAGRCDIYVNDAFGCAHRAEATTEGVTHHASLACAGPLLAAELTALGRALAAPRRPLVAIVGGSKVSTKLTILEALATQVNQLIVGGGIANTFLLAAGYPIGRSLAEHNLLPQAKAVMARLHERGARVPLPVDVVCAKTFDRQARAEIKPIEKVADDDLILDIGPVSAAALAASLQGAGTIVWNGPLGVFEFPAFSAGTQVLAQAIADSSAFSIAGGGDTLAAIACFGVTDRIDYISTGGGAFLEFLEGRSLPAVAALQGRYAQDCLRLGLPTEVPGLAALADIGLVSR